MPLVSPPWRVVGRKCAVLEVIKFAGPSGHQEEAVFSISL